MTTIRYRDPDLEDALSDIANKRGDWQSKAPRVAAWALHRLCDLENLWSNIRDKADEVHAMIHNPSKE